ncbi:adhesion G protein-coupled receptor E1-like isoform X1 [Notamacropus eugenii]|uniref:adhesion G protein-coupled receptor E1-like isoform X1 n=1 Tax=Notamacropus eugenii TaxID=9315 RepID=UPI003B67925F
MPLGHPSRSRRHSRLNSTHQPTVLSGWGTPPGRDWSHRAVCGCPYHCEPSEERSSSRPVHGIVSSHLGSHLAYPAGSPAGVGLQSFSLHYQTVTTFISPVQLGDLMDPTQEQEAVGSTECKAQGPSAPQSHPDWGHILRHLARLHKQMVACTLRFISSLGLLVSSAFLLAIPIIGHLKTIQSINTFIHLHLNFCHFLSHLLFLAGIIHWTLSKAMCIMISCIFHNLVLASFVWIFLGRLCFYLASWSLKVIDYLSTIQLFRKVLNFFGYGMPALYIGLFIAIQAHDINNYNNCWINPTKDSEWIFVSPICILMMVCDTLLIQ